MANEPVTTEEVLRAYRDCRRNKRNRTSTIEFEVDLTANITRIARQLADHTWRPGTSMCFAVTNPKPREVWAAQFADRVVHHVIYNRLRPRFEPSFLPTSFACIPGRGTHQAARWAERSLRRATAGWTRPAWTLQMDVANFFTSIDRHVLLDLLTPKIAEPWLAVAVERVVHHDVTIDAHFPGNPALLDQVPPHKSLWHAPSGKGLPIGNLTSQFAANVYMDVLDQHVVRTCRPRFYGRYVDDLLAVDPDRRRLAAMRDELPAFLRDRLRMEFHPGKTHLRNATAGVDFVGVVALPHRSYLRRSTARRGSRKLAKGGPAAGLMATANSYFGLARHVDTWRLRGAWSDKAARNGLVPADDRTKVTVPKEAPCPPAP